jgi:ABC-2 type transport system permease protein
VFNLVLKDILIQKKSLLYALLYTVFLSITFSSLKPSGVGLYVLAPIITAYMFINFAASFDEKNKSEIILNSLPLKRDDIVIAKYISIFIFAIICIIYSILIGFIGKTTGLPMYTRSISFLDIVLIFSSVCIVSSIFFPMYFKFGYTKSLIFNTMLFMVIFFLPILAIQYAGSNPNNIFVQKINSFIISTSSFTQNSLALIIGLILFLISLMISIHIYNNKEF